MLTILVLFVGLTLATAVIAYWSDNLGKKLGKKRVSLWGLRPRTTATFLTIASSWLIMVFTLGVMLTLFSPLRQALLRFDEVKAQERSLRTSKNKLDVQVGGLNEQLATLTSQTTSLKARVKSASDNLARVSEQLKKSGEAAKRARSEQKSAEKEADAARASADKSKAREQAAVKRERSASENLQIVTKQRDATQQQRETAQRELKAAQTDLKRASAEVKSADVRVKAASERVKIAQGNVKQAEAQFKQAQTDLKKVQQDLAIAQTNEQTAVTNAETARRNAEESKRVANEAVTRAANATTRAIEAGKQAINAGKEVIEADKKIAEAQKAVDQLQEQRKQLISINAQLSDDKYLSDLKRQIVQGSDIRVPVGFTLVARTFEQSLSFTEATQRLRATFNYAQVEVMPGDEETPPILPGAVLRLAAQPVLLPKVNESDDDVFVLVKEDDIYNSLATAISRSQTPLSVRLVVDRNHLAGEEFLDARFIIVPERPALPTNSELASVTFNKSMSDARLFRALLEMADAGREVARQSGVTPPLSPDTKEFYAPGTNEQIFEALRKVSALEGRARVSIVTDKAISTTDQLSVRFEVEPLASTTAQSGPRKSPA